MLDKKRQLTCKKKSLSPPVAGADHVEFSLKEAAADLYLWLLAEARHGWQEHDLAVSTHSPAAPPD